jgi:hypothetical protein
MTGPRDWDKEMAEIDRLLAKGGTPVAPSTPAKPAREGAPRSPAPVAKSSTPVVTRGHHIAGVWLRALLGVAAAAALPFWPYAKSCGTMFYLYLGTTFAVIVVGSWTMRYAWTHRRGVAHVAGLFVLLAGLAFAAAEILQHTSLAAVRLTWTCP